MRSGDLDVRVLTTLEEFGVLRDQWRSLLAQTEGGTFYQSHEFLQAWWKAFGDRNQLKVICTFREDVLAGALPLQLVEKSIFGIRTRVLQFMGMPDDILRPVFLVPGQDRAVLQALLSGIESLAAEWQLIRLEEVPAKAWFVPELRHWAKRHRFGYRYRDFHACPFLAKAGTWTDFMDSQSKRFPRRLRQTKNRLAKAGSVSYECLLLPEQADEFVRKYLQVEKRSWKDGKPAAVGRDTRYHDFYGKLLGAKGEEWRGHAMALAVDGQPVAVTLGVSWQGHYYSLQIAHDKGHDKYSPGLLLEAREMEWFFGNPELRRYEFLGGEVFSKRRWTERAVGTALIQLYKKTPRLSIYIFVKYFVFPAIRHLQRKFTRQTSASIDPFRFD